MHYFRKRSFQVSHFLSKTNSNKTFSATNIRFPFFFLTNVWRNPWLSRYTNIINVKFNNFRILWSPNSHEYPNDFHKSYLNYINNYTTLNSSQYLKRSVLVFLSKCKKKRTIFFCTDSLLHTNSYETNNLFSAIRIILVVTKPELSNFKWYFSGVYTGNVGIKTLLIIYCDLKHELSRQ